MTGLKQYIGLFRPARLAVLAALLLLAGQTLALAHVHDDATHSACAVCPLAADPVEPRTPLAPAYPDNPSLPVLNSGTVPVVSVDSDREKARSPPTV